ncbi:hypothetical protein [Pedobacter sp.]|uniref:hypothetical protein n=1 Tax=Pedobacter sp. TaxID=1411316 RepID=UPI00396C7DD8
MEQHNFDVDFVIPYSKQKVKINSDIVQVDQTTIRCEDIDAVKYGVSLVGGAKKPQRKVYAIEVKSKEGKTANIQFSSSKVEEMLAEDHTYYYIMSGLWQNVKKHLVNRFITQLNEQQVLEVGNAKFDHQGFVMPYKTWFWGKTKTTIVPWTSIRYFQDKGMLHIQDMHDGKKKLALSLHDDWNAVVLNTLMHYLWQEQRKEKLQKGEQI